MVLVLGWMARFGFVQVIESTAKPPTVQDYSSLALSTNKKDVLYRRYPTTLDVTRNMKMCSECKIIVPFNAISIKALYGFSICAAILFNYLLPGTL